MADKSEVWKQNVMDTENGDTETCLIPGAKSTVVAVTKCQSETTTTTTTPTTIPITTPTTTGKTTTIPTTTTTATTNGFHNNPSEKTKKETDGSSNKWEDRLKITRERQMESLKKKADGLKESELKAEECRRKADDERKKRLEELRKREEQHRVVVEERRKKMLEDENERRLALMKKTMGRESKLDQLKHRNADNKLLNGTKSPKQCQQQQLQSSPQQQQQVKRPHSVAGRPPSYASPTVASTTRMARSSEKDGEVITVCFRCRSAPPDFRSKFLEQQQQGNSGQNRSSHPVFSVTVPAMEFFTSRSSTSNGKENKQFNGKSDHVKTSVVLRPSESLSSKPPLPTIAATSKSTVQQKPRSKRPVSAVLESSRENTLAMLEARNLKNLQMQKQAGTSASSPSSIDSKKKLKNRFDLSLDLKKDHSADVVDDAKPKRKDASQPKKRSLSAIPDRKKIMDHDTGKNVFIAESSVGFAATTPFPCAKPIPSNAKQRTKVQKNLTNRLESKGRKLPVAPSGESRKKIEDKQHEMLTGDQLKERETSAPKPSFLAPKTKFSTQTAFEIKRPLPRLPKQLDEDADKKKGEDKKEVAKVKVETPKDETKKVDKPKEAKKAKPQSKVKTPTHEVKITEKVDFIREPAVKVEMKDKQIGNLKDKKVVEQQISEQQQQQQRVVEPDGEHKVQETSELQTSHELDSPQHTFESQTIGTDDDKQESNKQETKYTERDQEINKKEHERLEKLKKDEEERLNRKKRVDLIMKRVKPDESSRSSSVEKESKTSEDNVEKKEETSTVQSEMKTKENPVENPDDVILSEATEASITESLESNPDEEDELGEEVDGSKLGKSSFFNKLTSKLKKALSPSDKKGFPKADQAVNIQDLSGLLLQSALEKIPDEATSEESQTGVVEVPQGRRESSGFGFFGRISKKQSKDLSADDKLVKPEDSSKDSSPPSNGSHVTEKRKSITEAALNMFGMMSKQKRLSKELEVTPEEKTTCVQEAAEKKDSEDLNLVKNVEERREEEEEADDSKEKRVSPIVSEYVPGVEGDDDRSMEGIESIDGMDDVCRTSDFVGIGNIPLKPPTDLTKSENTNTVQEISSKDDDTKKVSADSNTDENNKGQMDEHPNVTITSPTTASVTSTAELKPPDMINITSPDMINIVVQKRDEDLSTNLSNLDSNPSGSTSSLDIVKSDDSSSGDILMSDESPTEQGKERGDVKHPGIREDEFRDSSQKDGKMEKAPGITEASPVKLEANLPGTT